MLFFTCQGRSSFNGKKTFPDEGYYENNGVSLCAEHHLQAEKTLLSCEELSMRKPLVKNPEMDKLIRKFHRTEDKELDCAFKMLLQDKKCTWPKIPSHKLWSKGLNKYGFAFSEREYKLRTK